MALQSSVILGGPVRTVSFSPDGTLVFSSLGSAMVVHALMSGAELLVVRPFPRSGSAVHGVRVAPRLDGDAASTLRLVVFGGKSVSAVELNCSDAAAASPTVALVDLRPLPTQRDWILDALLLRAAEFAGAPPVAYLGFADNVVDVCALPSLALRRRVRCGVRCMLRSMSLVVSAEDGRVLIAGGTMTNEVLLWAVPDAAAASGVALSDDAAAVGAERVDDVQRLGGHDGTVYCVAWAPGGSAVCSGSDDRTVRLWAPARVGSDDGGEEEDSPNPPRKRPRTSATLRRSFVQQWSKFGHSSRLWSCCFARSTVGDLALTTSEDACCRAWSVESGECVAILRGHVGKHAWCVSSCATASAATAIVATGGGDGCVKLWSLEAHLIQRQSSGSFALGALCRASQRTLPLLAAAETAPRSAGGRRDTSTEYVQVAALSPTGADATLVTSGCILPSSPSELSSLWSLKLAEGTFAQHASPPTSTCTAEGGGYATAARCCAMASARRDGSILVGGTDGTLCVYAANGALRASWRGHAARVSKVWWVADVAAEGGGSEAASAPALISASVSGDLRVWAFSASGEVLLIATYDVRRKTLHPTAAIDGEEDSAAADGRRQSKTKKKSSKQNASAVSVCWWFHPLTQPLIVCGDSRGRLHVVELLPTSDGDALMTSHALYLVRAHSHDVVPALAVLPGSVVASPGRRELVLASGGHDGRIVVWDLRGVAVAAAQGGGADAALTWTFTMRSALRASPISQVHRVWWSDPSFGPPHVGEECWGGASLLTAGFHGEEWRIVDLSAQVLLASIKCGGWKRAWSMWAAAAHPLRGVSLLFATVPAAAKRSPRRAVQVHSIGAQLIECASLNTSFHGRELNDVVWCPPEDAAATAVATSYIVATAGEDTLVRLFRVASSAGVAASSGRLWHWSAVQTLENHTSSARALAWTAPYLFSAGGQLQLNCWKVHDGGALVGKSHAQLVATNKLHRMRRRAGDPDVLEHRGLALAAFRVHRSDARILQCVAMGDSSGTVSIFVLNDVGGTLECVLECSACSPHPVLALEIVDAGGGASSACDEGTAAATSTERVAVVGSTDGSLRALDLRPLLRYLRDCALGEDGVSGCADELLDAASAIAAQDARSLNSINADAVLAIRSTLNSLSFSADVSSDEPLYRPHSCGANCLAALSAEDGTFAVLSGGDDQAIVATRVDASSLRAPRLMTLATRCGIAGSSLKGMRILRSRDATLWALCVGTEQRAHVLRITLGGVGGSGATTIEELSTIDVDVADISSIASIAVTEAWCDVAIVGTGMQVVRITL